MGPVSVSPISTEKIKWVSTSSSSSKSCILKHAICVEDIADQIRNPVYICRPLRPCDGGPTHNFDIGLFQRGDKQDCEILTDPAEKTGWKEIQGNFDRRLYGAIPANVEWRDEPNKFIGKIQWCDDVVGIGTISYKSGTWKFDLSPSSEAYLKDLNEREFPQDSLTGDTFTIEVLCLKSRDY